MLSFTVTGSGPPVVILHGLFGSAVNWRRIADALSSRWQVFSLDLPNHGDSPWTDDMSYPAQALAGFISGHVPEDPIVIGHSMSGKAAMALALCIQDAGHWLHVQKPGALIDAFEDFAENAGP
ncbi:MAG: alpha/beta fold hydrolase [Arenicellales bacterium]|nr:alpha/beta fold hydrolase [Arenicellales bacterium]MDP6552977.1 alpha/beta fold hydrolase [Arenicellales bacterium]MDP6791155.1 alpha/beta fold hydrolase [Arenicellales bacterium]MDP6918845.1 alpha/beta fold hydrolase [Arenicellales bacterium]